MLKWMARKLLHYGHAVEMRGMLLAEFSRLRRRGAVLPKGLAMRIVRQPADVEDLLNLARFIGLDERILLVDVGGNVGDWAADFLAVFPNTRVVAFEPDPRASAKYAERLCGSPSVTLHEVALSSQSGSSVLHLAEDSVYSSLETYSDTQSPRDIGHHRDCEITLKTLDSFELNLAGYDCRVMKLDVQGHELDVIAGACATLAGIDILIGEFSFATQYDGGEPSFSRACELLRAAGLYPAVFQDYGRQLGPYAYERDVLFVRRGRLDRLYGWE